MRLSMTRTAGLVGILALALTLGAGAATSRLPVRHYTSADGLAQDQVLRLALDADGFLWIATAGGLSRFDGSRFANFDETEGLRGRIINDIAVGRFGTYWVATEAGLFAFRPGETAPARSLFREVPLAGVPDGDEPFRLLLTRTGTLWVGTMSRLWRVTPAGDGFAVVPVDLALDRARRSRSRVQSLAEDPGGAVWIGTHSDGIFRIGLDGRVEHCPAETPGANFVRDFLFPGDGSLWTAYFGGVAIFQSPPFPGSGRMPAPPARLYGTGEGLAIDTTGLVPLSDDRVLVATTSGISEMLRSSAGAWRVGLTLDRRTGLPGDLVSALVRDAHGSLWAGLGTSGLVKIFQSGFSTIEITDEAGGFLVDLARDREGRVVGLAAKGAKTLAVYQPDADPPGPYPVHLPASITYVGWGGGQKFLVDSAGSWWIATGSGVLRYDDRGREGPRRLTRPPDALLGVADGLPGVDAFVLSEDSHNDVWLSVAPVRDEASAISRWSRATGKVENFLASAVGSRSLAQRFLETRDGSLWIMLMNGKLLRYREGRFQAIHGASELGESGEFGDSISEILEDSMGRLWTIGREAHVCEQPAVAEPRFVRREIGTREEGLLLRCGVEDRDGRLWFGTDRGVIRLDPGTGRLRRFTVDDGLVGNSIGLCERDGSGALWFSDQTGLSRFQAQIEAPFTLAGARVREIRVAGEAIPLPANGAISTSVLTIPADRRRLAVEFFSIHQGPGPPPRFQYRLEGLDPDWSAPTTDRSVQYADLATGRYGFQVRTVDEDGTPSSAPATVPLHVLAPVWQRPWFLALVLGAGAALAYTVYRARVARMIALERIRTRIATDLHDDIGSSLSQISILSQLARRREDDGRVAAAASTGGAPDNPSECDAFDGARGDVTPAAPDALERITVLSGELIDAMSDVVWAISPRWDTVSALVHRMRRFASELFADGASELELRLPEGPDAPVDPDVRRQLYLVFKEALHNVRRHASAQRVMVELRHQSPGWILRIEEDGQGFDASRENEGHGLRSMRRRAEMLGGSLHVRSSPEGTHLEMTLPEGKSRSRWMTALSILTRARRHLSNE